ncbi:hypothetical protein DFH09DRAFT_1105010 [Mycena vulgaris]|nr:hypothetical protein DFH09DRAFT_1105010 [Mycena vulgaris]
MYGGTNAARGLEDGTRTREPAGGSNVALRAGRESTGVISGGKRTGGPREGENMYGFKSSGLEARTRFGSPCGGGAYEKVHSEWICKVPSRESSLIFYAKGVVWDDEGGGDVDPELVTYSERRDLDGAQ